jgi:hypothetical protein
LTAYSQSLIINNKDTLICFSSDKAKFLAKQYHKAETYYLADSLCQQQLIFKGNQVNLYKKNEDKLQTIIGNQVSIIKFKDEENKSLTIQMKGLNLEVKKQKRLKGISIIFGVSCLVFALVK